MLFNLKKTAKSLKCWSACIHKHINIYFFGLKFSRIQKVTRVLRQQCNPSENIYFSHTSVLFFFYSSLFKGYLIYGTPRNVCVLKSLHWQRQNGFVLKTGRWEEPGSIPYHVCRPSFLEFSVVFSETHANTC